VISWAIEHPHDVRPALVLLHDPAAGHGQPRIVIGLDRGHGGLLGREASAALADVGDHAVPQRRVPRDAACQLANRVGLPVFLVGLQAPGDLAEQELPVRTDRLLAEDLAMLFAQRRHVHGYERGDPIPKRLLHASTSLT
jgi:hypothetical protein